MASAQVFTSADAILPKDHGDPEFWIVWREFFAKPRIVF
jgi:hypothetical protein